MENQHDVTRPLKTRRSHGAPPWVANLIMLVLGIIIGGVGHWMIAPAAAPGGSGTLFDTLVAKTRHFRGNSNAPVTMIMISDFQCPYCGRFATGAARQIDQLYIATGIVRFGYVHMAFLGPESKAAAAASECADEQGKFWEYHDMLFANQNGENQGAFSTDNLKKFAEDLKLDTAKFNACVDSGKYSATVEDETAFAQSLGVSSTPAFMINGQPVVGAQPIDQFRQIIETARSQKK